MSSPIDALEVRAAPSVQLSVEEILFPELSSLTPGLRTRVNEKLAATTRLAEFREKARSIIEMAGQGYPQRHIARGLGIPDAVVKLALRRARKAGLIDDAGDILNYEAVPEAAKVVMHHLTKYQDRGTAFEVLKGTGRFKTFNNTKNEGVAGGGALPPLQVNVVFNQQQGAMPLPGQIALDVSEATVGTPREDK
jgi:DNA-binding Lrp family transcriptional regulator